MRQRLLITEDEKKNIKSQYEGEFNKDFYDFLQKTISVDDNYIEGIEKPFVLLYIGDKSRLLSNSKKYLVSAILNEYEDEFPDLPESTLRLTAKYFIDQIRKNFYYE
jgi:hypothetical protein